MKIIKRLMAGVVAISLTVALSGCGNSEPSGIAVSDALNAKEMLPIIATNSSNDEIKWAGYIGKGKIKALYLEGSQTSTSYRELKKYSNEDFDEALKSFSSIRDGDGKVVKKEKFITKKAETILTPNEDGDKTDHVSFNFLDKNKGIDHTFLKQLIEEDVYSSTVEKNPDSEWSVIKAQTDEDDSSEGDALHIKTSKNYGIKMENPEKYTEKYDNVEIDPNW